MSPGEQELLDDTLKENKKLISDNKGLKYERVDLITNIKKLKEKAKTLDKIHEDYAVVITKAEKWDKHSRTIESILHLKRDIDTLYDYEIANLLPTYLVAIHKDRTSIQRLNQNKILEQQNKQLKAELKSKKNNI